MGCDYLPHLPFHLDIIKIQVGERNSGHVKSANAQKYPQQIRLLFSLKRAIAQRAEDLFEKRKQRQRDKKIKAHAQLSSHTCCARTVYYCTVLQCTVWCTFTTVQSRNAHSRTYLPPPTDCCILLPSDGCINDSFISMFFLGIFEQSLNFPIQRQINFSLQWKTMMKEYQLFIRGHNREIKNLVTLPLYKTMQYSK